MVQILESWGKDLGAGIGQGLSTAAQFGAQMKLKEKEKADRLKLIQEIEGMNPQNTAKALQGNPQDADPFEKAKRYAAAGEHELAKLETERAKSLIKERSAQKEKSQLSSTFGNILTEMKDLKDYVGPTKLAALNPFSETAGKRSKINTLRLSLEGLFRDLTLKGQFPKAIYERILKELPQASDTPEQYSNKIEAIEKILESQMARNPMESLSSNLKNVEPGTPLTIESMQQIYDTVGGDKQKAKALAKKMGYDIK